MTTATEQLPPHGSLHRRKIYACKCPKCRAADREYTNRRSRLQAYGQWQPFVDAEPVRRHVRMLGTYGIGWQRAARLAGASTGGVSKLLYGDPQRNQGPTKRVRPETAARLLAVRPTFENIAPSARVNGTGTARRLQALVAIGWPQMRLGTYLGADRSLMWQQIRSTSVEASTAVQARELYERLWNTDPSVHRVQKRYSDQARQIAARHGWPPPAAWDDDTIDDPAALPDCGLEVPRYIAIAENGQELEALGYTRDQAAERLGISRDYLQKCLSAQRAKEAA